MISETDNLWIKICGIRDVDTAVCVADLGADAIGLNFYAKSPRHVPDIETARNIVAAVPDHVQTVGVFVNHTSREIADICAATGIDLVQLHGDEPDNIFDELGDLRVIRALRIDGDPQDTTTSLLQRYQSLQSAPEAWLIDARVEGAFGGTGQTVDWNYYAPVQRSEWLPLILAGGLRAENVGEAISIVHPFGVDVASGVESSPGVKDLALVEQLISNCRQAG